MRDGCLLGVDVGDGVDNGEKMSLDLEVVLRDAYGNDKMGSTGCGEPLKQDSVFLPKKWEPDLWRRGGDRRCLLISPTCDSASLESSAAFVKWFGV